VCNGSTHRHLCFSEETEEEESKCMPSLHPSPPTPRPLSVLLICHRRYARRAFRLNRLLQGCLDTHPSSDRQRIFRKIIILIGSASSSPTADANSCLLGYHEPDTRDQAPAAAAGESAD